MTIKIIPLARSNHGNAKNLETNSDTWKQELASFPENVRNHAANMAAHSHDITLVGDRLLVSCSWYNSKDPQYGTGWYGRDGSSEAISKETWDQLYPVGGSSEGERLRRENNRTYTIHDDFLKKEG